MLKFLGYCQKLLTANSMDKTGQTFFGNTLGLFYLQYKELYWISKILTKCLN